MSRNESYKITVSGVSIKVTKKKVKHLRIVAYPSSGEVRISSPVHLSFNEVKRFAESRSSWIQKHLNNPDVVKTKDSGVYNSGTTHYLWGKPFTLIVQESGQFGVQNIDSENVKLFVEPGSSQDIRERVLREWYRVRIKNEIPRLIKKWEPVMGVKVNDWGVKKMKTRWGTCNTSAKRIWLNLELAKREPEFLEYIVVHEMTHILERLHSRRFYSLMDRFMPDWRTIDKKLGGKHWNKR